MRPIEATPFTIVDDDGVLVLASASALRARAAGEPFDYRFPRELLARMAAADLCAWYSGGEDEYAIVVEGEESRLFAPPADDAQVIEHTLRLRERDELLLMPYSAFTLACDSSGSSGPRVPGLSAAVGVFDAGEYEVRVGRRPQQRCSFVVAIRVAATARPSRERDDLPGWRE